METQIGFYLQIEETSISLSSIISYDLPIDLNPPPLPLLKWDIGMFGLIIGGLKHPPSRVMVASPRAGINLVAVRLVAARY